MAGLPGLNGGGAAAAVPPNMWLKHSQQIHPRTDSTSSGQIWAHESCSCWAHQHQLQLTTNIHNVFKQITSIAHILKIRTKTSQQTLNTVHWTNVNNKQDVTDIVPLEKLVSIDNKLWNVNSAGAACVSGSSGRHGNRSTHHHHNHIITVITSVFSWNSLHTQTAQLLSG